VVSDQMPVPVGDAVLADVLAFIRDRLYVWLRSEAESRGAGREPGLPHDVVAAVLAEQAHDPYRAAITARELAALVQSAGWAEVLIAYARCKRIVRPIAEVYPLAPERYTEPATRALYEAWLAADRQWQADRSVANLGRILGELRDPINRFFTDVLVMADDPAVRQARLALVQRIAAIPDGIADLSQLQGF